MKNIFAVVLLTIIGVVAGQCPNGIRMRKEFRDLTTAEWNTYKSAVQNLVANGRIGFYTQMHLTYMNQIHRNPAFFPWHRAFIFAFERELQTINSSIMLPYWDWTFDSQRPLSSAIFQSQYLGTQVGTAGDCNWRMTVPTAHCLRRIYDRNNFTTYYSKAAIDRLILASSSYDTFRSSIEGAPHGIVHVSLGGDMAQMYSPNDPIFWLHHAFIDKIWWDRQRNPRYTNQYDGVFNRRTVRTTDVLTPFSWTVAFTLNTSNMCYAYQNFTRVGATTSAMRMSDAASSQETIIPPMPLPADWIKLNHLDEQEVRNVEQQLNSAIQTATTTTVTTPTAATTSSPTNSSNPNTSGSKNSGIKIQPSILAFLFLVYLPLIFL